MNIEPWRQASQVGGLDPRSAAGIEQIAACASGQVEQSIEISANAVGEAALPQFVEACSLPIRYRAAMQRLTRGAVNGACAGGNLIRHRA